MVTEVLWGGVGAGFEEGIEIGKTSYVTMQGGRAPLLACSGGSGGGGRQSGKAAVSTALSNFSCGVGPCSSGGGVAASS